MLQLRTIIFALFLLPIVVQSQNLKYSLTWDHTIDVVPATINYRDTARTGLAFNVYESDARVVAKMWREKSETKSRTFTNDEPMVALGARFEQLSADPLTMVATTKGDRKTGTVQFALAFIPNDSIALPSAEMQEMFMRELAVDFNRQVISTQIKEQKELVGKADGKFEKSQGKEEKLNANINKVKANLSRVKASRMKEEARNARIKSEIIGYEQKFTLSNNPKDLKKLTKKRTELAKGEEKVAALMEKEVKLQNEQDKLASELPNTARRLEDDKENMKDRQRILDSLQTKLESVR
jgi:hypothetical protein